MCVCTNFFLKFKIKRAKDWLEKIKKFVRLIRFNRSHFVCAYFRFGPIFSMRTCMSLYLFAESRQNHKRSLMHSKQKLYYIKLYYIILYKIIIFIHIALLYITFYITYIYIILLHIYIFTYYICSTSAAILFS